MEFVKTGAIVLTCLFIVQMASFGMAIILPAAIPSVTATVSGINGRIVFQSTRDGNYEIYTMNADGTGQTNISNNPSDDFDPSWSPDGTKIAFVSYRNGIGGVYVMNFDGTGQTNISNSQDSQPTWSPDGTKIAFRSFDVNVRSYEIYIMNANGTGRTNISTDPSMDMSPSWSPDGTKIIFQTNRDGNGEIYAINTDGTGQVNISNSPFDEFVPSWSPDGTKIAYERDNEIYTMNADGTEQTNISNRPYSVDSLPDWGVLTSNPVPSTVTIHVNSTNMTGSTFNGMWAEIWQNNALVKEGFTSFSASVSTGEQYEIFMNDWGQYTFDHWEDNTTINPRQVSISDNTTFTAYYQITNPPPPSSTNIITVQSSDLNGNIFPGQWVELWRDGQIMQENFTPFSAIVGSGDQYSVFIYDDPAESKYFDHWDNATSNNPRSFAITSDTTFTAFFMTP